MRTNFVNMHAYIPAMTVYHYWIVPKGTKVVYCWTCYCCCIVDVVKEDSMRSVNLMFYAIVKPELRYITVAIQSSYCSSGASESLATI